MMTSISPVFITFLLQPSHIKVVKVLLLTSKESYVRSQKGKEVKIKSSRILKKPDEYYECIVLCMSVTGSTIENKRLMNSLMSTQRRHPECFGSHVWIRKRFAITLSVVSPRTTFDESCFKSLNWCLKNIWISVDRPKSPVLIVRWSVVYQQVQTPKYIP